MANLNEQHIIKLWDKMKEYVKEHGSSGYTLPVATDTKLGGVKASDDVQVASDGTMDIESISSDTIKNLPI